MELGNNRWPDTRMIKNVCQSLFEAPPHQLVSHSPLSWKFTSEYGFDQVLAYKLDALETSTDSRFQISSYHDLEATQIKYISGCIFAWKLSEAPEDEVLWSHRSCRNLKKKKRISKNSEIYIYISLVLETSIYPPFFLPRRKHSSHTWWQSPWVNGHLGRSQVGECVEGQWSLSLPQSVHVDNHEGRACAVFNASMWNCLFFVV